MTRLASLSICVVGPRLYGDLMVLPNTDCENVAGPPAEIGMSDGSAKLAKLAVMISPRPCRKSVSTLATWCSKRATSLLGEMVARIRWWLAARARPWRKIGRAHV